MGLFDFLRPNEKKSEGLKKDRYTSNIVLAYELEYVKKEVSNLTAVGRKEDANKRISTFLQKCFEEYQKEPDNPVHLKLYSTAAISLGALDVGKETLEMIIQANQDELRIDLTSIYFDLGRIYHRIHGTCEKELWAFQMATQCQSPTSCKFPATSALKAKAHYFAHSCADVLQNEAQATYHDQMARKLVPELDWDDRGALLQWIQNN